MLSFKNSGQSRIRGKTRQSKTALSSRDPMGRQPVDMVRKVLPKADRWLQCLRSRAAAETQAAVEVDALSYYDSIYQDFELSHRAKVVYIYLKDHANKDGTCWPGINTIAAGLNLSRSTVKRALDDLVRAELVEKSSRWRENGSLSSNLYQIK